MFSRKAFMILYTGAWNMFIVDRKFAGTVNFVNLFVDYLRED